MAGTRREHDLLGEREVPQDRYYGIQTLRALENYDITGIPISHYPDFIRSMADAVFASNSPSSRLAWAAAFLIHASERMKSG